MLSSAVACQKRRDQLHVARHRKPFGTWPMPRVVFWSSWPRPGKRSRNEVESMLQWHECVWLSSFPCWMMTNDVEWGMQMNSRWLHHRLAPFAGSSTPPGRGGGGVGNGLLCSREPWAANSSTEVGMHYIIYQYIFIHHHISLFWPFS